GAFYAGISGGLFAGLAQFINPDAFVFPEMIRRPIQQYHCPRQRRVASAGFGWWRRHVAPARLRGVLACPSGNVGEPRRRSAMAPRPGALDKKLPPRRGYFLRLRTTGMHLCFGVLARGARIQLSAI